ncbi:MAG: hypothetical protein JNG89_13965 [Planctomycetaceae bacterium]|nr:hypothetical protein [Planctomycetaceae bacterium]
MAARTVGGTNCIEILRDCCQFEQISISEFLQDFSVPSRIARVVPIAPEPDGRHREIPGDQAISACKNGDT